MSPQANTYSECHNGKYERQAGGRPREQIWNYYKTSDSDTHGYQSATCNYCPKHWGRGRPGEMEAHLANCCPGVSEEVKNYWQNSLANKIRNYKRTDNTKCSNLKQSDHDESIEPLSIYEQNEIDKTVLKA
ncbi:hypothetical protein C1646_672689 [Rhizophagus diaphanus]|nr:hypothetical protein C1646_672689 [Rhizophagus diaphanus] [Rhizophagus sp. MUCL 43196]